MAEKASATKSAEGRTRRLVEQPFEELDAAAGKDGGPSLRGAARSAAVTALAAAVAGALGGAAKAVLDRRDESQDNGAAPPPEEQTEQEEPEEENADEQRSEPSAEADDADEEQDEDADAPLTRDEQVEADEQQDEPDERADGDDGPPEQEQGAAPNEVAAMVERAKQQLREVLGSETESVSGLERANGRWIVSLEVVEVRRIPESTDVLASYEVVLDDDGGIVSMQRRHRYRRSQVEEDR
jgi:hypothetical protein